MEWCRSRIEVRGFFAELHTLLRRWDFLCHPFCVRWSDGELSPEDLARYACQCEHTVIATAAAAMRAAGAASPGLRTQLGEQAGRAAGDIVLWRAFRNAVGCGRADAPLEATVHCARAWAGTPSRCPEATLAVLYAIESNQPRIAAVKRDALGRHYGVTDSVATAYFDAHAQRAQFARLRRAQLEPRLHAGIESDLLASVDAALSGYWQLLSSLDSRREELC